MGAKRRLNSTSKSEQTDTQTDGRTNRLIESIGPEGQCFEKKHTFQETIKIIQYVCASADIIINTHNVVDNC